MSNENGNEECFISDWHPLSKGMAVGKFTLHLASGLIIDDFAELKKGDSRWVGMPCQRFIGRDGTEKREPIIKFRDNKTADRFRKMVLDAIDRYHDNVARNRKAS
jgi:hypothetical protein